MTKVPVVPKSHEMSMFSRNPSWRIPDFVLIPDSGNLPTGFLENLDILGSYWDFETLDPSFPVYTVCKNKRHVLLDACL